jgi:hypothetical protein
MNIIKKIISFFKTKKKEVFSDPKLKLIYESKSGEKWFTFYDPLQIPYKRAIQAEAMTRMAEFNITKERLQLFIDKFTEASAKKDWILNNHILYQLQVNLLENAEEQTLMNLAACYIVGENENLNDISSQEMKIKIDLWSKDSELCAFFLQFAWMCTRQYGKNSNLDILNYLKKVRKMPLYRSAHEIGYKDSLIK